MRKTKLVFLRLSWCIPNASGMIFSRKSLLIFSFSVHNRKNLLKFLINFITDRRQSVEYLARFFIFFFEFKIYSFMLVPTFLKKTIMRYHIFFLCCVLQCLPTRLRCCWSTRRLIDRHGVWILVDHSITALPLPSRSHGSVFTESHSHFELSILYLLLWV